MKPLDDDQKEKVWEEIIRALISDSHLMEGEMTIDDIYEKVDPPYSRDRLRKKLNNLAESGILGRRTLALEGARSNVYFPISEAESFEDILESLGE
jgi:predicted transcriptional regulator